MPKKSASPTTNASAGKFDRFPAAPEDLTLKKIRDAIPAEMFNQNTLKSFYYVCRDFAQIYVTYYLMYNLVLPWMNALPLDFNSWLGFAVKAVVWNVFWWVQGLNFTAIWVMAHECGHRAFSPSTKINDLVGFLLHSALLVPYHSWRISHGNHHKHTNHTDKDTAFVPEKVGAIREALSESPLLTAVHVVAMVTIGWPLYLCFNVTGQKYNRSTSHFEPSSPLFRVTDREDILVSDVGMLLAIGAIAWASYSYTFVNVMCWYGVPYLWTNFWLVLITFLHHTDVRVPHYNANEWNFVRGALATVDRNYGWAINWWVHHIVDSHVVHHLFSTMPFYNAIQVTDKYIKPVLGPYYHYEDKSLFKTTWESFRQCRYIIPSEGIAYFYQ